MIASTRPGRIGLPIGEWVVERAREHGRFEVDTIDLKEVNLPMFDEPKHPRLARYEHAHTKRWSQRIAALDALVLVTPEYNYAPPPSLLNALDYLYVEWNYKPAAFVSYGGASSGLRAVTMLRATTSGLRMMPIPEGIAIGFPHARVKEGVFVADEADAKAATAMFDELHRWSDALRALR